MLRSEIEKLELNDILKIINEQHGLTKGNSLVSREMTRIYNKAFHKDIQLAVKKEAAIRVLCGQNGRINPLEKLSYVYYENNNMFEW